MSTRSARLLAVAVVLVLLAIHPWLAVLAIALFALIWEAL